MAVARTYENCEALGNPFKSNGKWYISVNYKGTPRQVRWYSEAEYSRMYGVTRDPKDDPFWKSQKDVLGFKNGYIWIFTGATYEHKEELKAFGCVFRRYWGWSLSSELELPDTLPEDVSALKLEWSLVGANDEKLMAEDEVAKRVKELIYQNTPHEESTSNYVGEEGERLELNVVVTRNIPVSGFRGGVSYMHIMEDEDGNVFVWTTASKCWETNSEHHIKGTVKTHKEYNGTRQTILTRCMEVK